MGRRRRASHPKRGAFVSFGAKKPYLSKVSKLIRGSEPEKQAAQPPPEQGGEASRAPARAQGTLDTLDRDGLKEGGGGSKAGKPMRDQMPAVAAFVDAMREAFGAEEINQAIAAGIKQHPGAGFFATENGHQVGQRVDRGR